jgi:hypothetical protein
MVAVKSKDFRPKYLAAAALCATLTQGNPAGEVPVYRDGSPGAANFPFPRRSKCVYCAAS